MSRENHLNKINSIFILGLFILLTLFLGCDKYSHQSKIVGQVSQNCRNFIKEFGADWKCNEPEPLKLSVVPPTPWPAAEKERRTEILNLADRTATFIKDKDFSIEVSFGMETVAAHYIHKAKRAQSSYGAFGLAYGSSAEFELVEVEQKLEVVKIKGAEHLKHFVKVKNQSGKTIPTFRIRSCIESLGRRNCEDRGEVQGLKAGQVHFWSVDMGELKDPDVNAWYEMIDPQGNLLLAYRPWPGDIYRSWVKLLREIGNDFVSWKGEGGDPERFLKSSWIVSSSFLEKKGESQKQSAKRLYDKIILALKNFYPEEYLARELEIGIYDEQAAFVFSYSRTKSEDKGVK